MADNTRSEGLLIKYSFGRIQWSQFLLNWIKQFGKQVQSLQSDEPVSV